MNQVKQYDSLKNSLTCSHRQEQVIGASLRRPAVFGIKSEYPDRKIPELLSNLQEHRTEKRPKDRRGRGAGQKGNR